MGAALIFFTGPEVAANSLNRHTALTLARKE